MSGEETIFTWGAPPLKIGWGASDEIGFDLGQYGVRRVLILTDPGLVDTGIPHRIADRLRAYEIAGEIFAGVHVEPTDESMQAAIAYAAEHGPWDAFVAVGGGQCDRHGQGGQPADHVPRRADGLPQRTRSAGPGSLRGS